ncbi:isocyanide synthase family protein [Stenotrophomonas chelatiphaga]|uniref:isocyanide synthase family protein n=1 Tax=Stenotrophomonas chelatiphaga TaxID=517011 RepID=UPI00289D4492|nr:isocyanide synthase family protein [Stenotrophomonas chelatiphaga]
MRPPRDAAETRVHDIAQRLARHQRCDRSGTLAPALSDPLMARLRDFVQAGEAVHMVLPAFPAKSPSRRKVLGTLPDLAEALSLDALERLCARIAAIHPAGARLTICSDGHVFGPTIGVSDPVIDQYQAGIKDMIARRGLRHLDTFCLLDGEHLHGTAAPTPEQRRAALMMRHGHPLADIRSELLRTDGGLRQLRGIIRFMAEDDWRPDDPRSATQIQRHAKSRAYQVIQHSLAWGNFLQQRFPRSLRLSIHPQAHGSDKLGIHMLPTADAWLTPWHAVAVDLGDRTVLMKRHQAENQGARLVHVEGRPSHYRVWPDQRRRVLQDRAAA